MNSRRFLAAEVLSMGKLSNIALVNQRDTRTIVIGSETFSTSLFFSAFFLWLPQHGHSFVLLSLRLLPFLENQVDV